MVNCQILRFQVSENGNDMVFHISDAGFKGTRRYSRNLVIHQPKHQMFADGYVLFRYNDLPLILIKV